MENNQDKNSIQENVLNAIETGHVKMRPKWHFALNSALLVLGGVLISMALIYLVSFIIFILRQTGVLFIPGFGTHGVNVFLTSAPWLLILIALLFIVLLQILIKKYSFGYGKPLMYSAIAIIGLGILGGILVEKTSFHRGLFRQAEDRGLPFAGVLYRQYGEHRPESITVGYILEIIPGGLKIDSLEEENLLVLVTPKTNIIPGARFNVEDKIVVFGQRLNSTIMAEGIREFDGEIMRPPMRGKIIIPQPQ